MVVDRLDRADVDATGRLPGEQHGIGLLMTEAILLTREIPSLNLGTQIPIPQLAMVTEKTDARAIGLSFSASFPARKLRPMLKELLEAIPETLEVLIGGAGALHIKRPPKRVRLIRKFSDL